MCAVKSERKLKLQPFIKSLPACRAHTVSFLRYFSSFFISQISEIQLINIVFVIIFVHTQLMRQKEWKWMCIHACKRGRERKDWAINIVAINRPIILWIQINVRTTTVNSEFQPNWCLCLHLHLYWPSPCMTNIGDVGSFFSNNLLQCRDLQKKHT